MSKDKSEKKVKKIKADKVAKVSSEAKVKKAKTPKSEKASKTAKAPANAPVVAMKPAQLRKAVKAELTQVAVALKAATAAIAKLI